MCHRKIVIKNLLYAASQTRRKLTHESRNVRHSEVASLCKASSRFILNDNSSMKSLKQIVILRQRSRNKQCLFRHFRLNIIFFYHMFYKSFQRLQHKIGPCRTFVPKYKYMTCFLYIHFVSFGSDMLRFFK